MWKLKPTSTDFAKNKMPLRTLEFNIEESIFKNAEWILLSTGSDILNLAVNIMILN